MSGIDTLIALQDIEDPTERRRRAVKHGRRAPDALDELKPAASVRGRILDAPAPETVAADLKKGSGDEKLDQVLKEIELRWP